MRILCIQGKKYRLTERQKLQKLFKRVSLASLLGLILALLLGPDDPNAEAGNEAILGGLSALVGMVSVPGYFLISLALAAASPTSFFKKVKDYDELKETHAANVRAAEKTYESELADYEANLKKYKSEELVQLEQENKKIEAENDALATEREKLAELHHNLIIEYTNSVNNFLKANEPMQQFLPLLPEPAGA